MQLFNKIKDPVIFKESDTMERQLHILEEYWKEAPEDSKPFIEKDMNLLRYGILGEKNILYELKNSHMPMYVLHDLYFEIDGCQAQIDFLVITGKLIFVLECKNLYGNIEVNEQGNFVRTLQFGKRYQKEGIYSPITQNEHHMEVLKKIRSTSKANILSKAIFNKYFDKNYRSVVVLSNPKTYLNIKDAPKDIKQHIIRYDQLIRYIKEENKKSDKEPNPDKYMKELAEFFAGAHIEKEADYIEKYKHLCTEQQVDQNIEISIEESAQEVAEDQVTRSESHVNTVADSERLRQELKAYRLKKSREEGIKPYYIYNNLQMEAIIEQMPRSLEELKQVNGIAEKKCGKYGEDILQIINKCGRL